MTNVKAYSRSKYAPNDNTVNACAILTLDELYRLTICRKYKIASLFMTPYHDTLYGWVAFVVKYIMTYSFARSLLAEMFIIKTYTLQRNLIGKGVEPQQSS